MIAKFYCPVCGKEIKEDEVKYNNWYEDVNAGDDPICPNCGSVLEEEVELCDICGKELYNTDGEHICRDCAEKYATVDNAVKLIEDQTYDKLELYKELVSIFYDENDFKEMVIKSIKEIEKQGKEAVRMFGGSVIYDDIKKKIGQFYLNHEDLFTDSECEIVEKLDEED